MTASDTILTAPELANLLAGKAVAGATSFLDGRSDAARLADVAEQLLFELMAVGHDPAAASILDPARLLVLAMLRLAASREPWRRERWRQITAALIELVRRESTELRLIGVQRS